MGLAPHRARPGARGRQVPRPLARAAHGEPARDHAAVDHAGVPVAADATDSTSTAIQRRVDAHGDARRAVRRRGDRRAGAWRAAQAEQIAAAIAAAGRAGRARGQGDRRADRLPAAARAPTSRSRRTAAAAARRGGGPDDEALRHHEPRRPRPVTPRSRWSSFLVAFVAVVVRVVPARATASAFDGRRAGCRSTTTEPVETRGRPRMTPDRATTGCSSTTTTASRSTTTRCRAGGSCIFWATIVVLARATGCNVPGIGTGPGPDRGLRARDGGGRAPGRSSPPPRAPAATEESLLALDAGSGRAWPPARRSSRPTASPCHRADGGGHHRPEPDRRLLAPRRHARRRSCTTDQRRRARQGHAGVEGPAEARRGRRGGGLRGYAARHQPAEPEAAAGRQRQGRGRAGRRRRPRAK